LDTTLENVESGHEQLVKLYDNVMSNRWLIMKVFMILMVFAIFFSVFVA
jgi:syntaxin 5